MRESRGMATTDQDLQRAVVLLAVAVHDLTAVVGLVNAAALMESEPRSLADEQVQELLAYTDGIKKLLLPPTD
jgi:hypothetical protein